ncbi:MULTISPECIES: GvpL/GvpF family gas vesicle protein [unclassified Streptomyces]|uniref:GvpL/GvpF family gas vesicle protein n=1 Tax=unclassified Streptomyces TaxID=2593676 RepID=UPI002E15FEAF|nr:GvpL/GvpF family gas vesicle protein [Streptomyces sp. NBC_01197]WSS49460.1 GvpL/GvpF family gas vesicle protein [Streptomyces sp. NBC_01180]
MTSTPEHPPAPRHPLGQADSPGAAPATYVFAVCGPDRPARVDPAHGHPGGGPLRFLPVGSLRAVVQDVPAEAFSEASLRERLADPAELERCARTHHDVVTAAATGGPTVPLPLATLYLGDERAAAALGAEQERFRAALDRIAGRAEWAVKVYLTQSGAGDGAAHSGDGAAPSETPAPPAPPPPSVPGEGAGRAYLNRLRGIRRLREERQDHALAAAEQVDAAVRELAVGSVRRRPHGPEATGEGRAQVMNAAYLIAQERSEELATTLGLLRGSPGFHGIDIEISGPWAPYSFTDGANLAGHP